VESAPTSAHRGVRLNSQRPGVASMSEHAAFGLTMLEGIEGASESSPPTFAPPVKCVPSAPRRPSTYWPPPQIAAELENALSSCEQPRDIGRVRACLMGRRRPTGRSRSTSAGSPVLPRSGGQNAGVER